MMSFNNALMLFLPVSGAQSTSEMSVDLMAVFFPASWSDMLLGAVASVDDGATTGAATLTAKEKKWD
jgi:hypothetical protein